MAASSRAGVPAGQLHAALAAGAARLGPVIAVLGHHQVDRDQHDRGGAAVGRGAQRDLDVVPRASWPATNRPSRSLPDRSNGGGLASRSLISASAPRSGPARGPRSRPRSPGRPRRRSDDHGVFGGEKITAFSASSAIRWMTSATAGPLMRRRVLAEHRDPGVVLHLGDRGAQHVDERHRVAPAAAGASPDRMIRLSACRRIRVVRWSIRNRSSSSSGSLGPPLHGVEQGELAVQQRLAAPGQVAEDVADPVPQPGLVHGRLDGGLLHRVERQPDLADLVRLAGSSVNLGGDVHVLPRASRLHHGRQPLVGQVQRRVAQLAQLGGPCRGRPGPTPGWTPPRPAGRGRRPRSGAGRWTWRWRWPGSVISADARVPALDSPAATPPTACCQAAGDTAGGLPAAVSPASRSSRADSADKAAGLTLRA